MAVKLKSTLLFYLFLAIGLQSCAQAPIVSGAENFEKYLHNIANKKVGIVAHQASLVFGKTHLIDTLLSLGVAVQKVFAPEHGFRGRADAGETIYDQKDKKTGLQILSLHGKTKKPSEESLENISVMIFDLQDVGVRFYTYLSTLHNVMEACAENDIPLIVLDRPNPNAHYVDGPVLSEENKSFLGMHPEPIVYGMTIGEYAKMINGEGWLNNKLKCDLTIIKLKNYSHKTSYELPVRPSPNLPNKEAIALYPSLCLLEPTKISVGRGTEMQFQIYGHPDLNKD
ncbi:MAG: exo-beta-N-acetylmuramidase NamZ family protein, partial [Flavobacteriales bacterium]